MAQQLARRDRDNQAATPYLEYAALIWTRSANSHAGRRSNGRARGRTDGSIRLRATAILTFSLALKGASTDVAWIRQESSRINHLWRLTDSEVSSLFSGLAYPCNKMPPIPIC